MLLTTFVKHKPKRKLNKKRTSVDILAGYKLILFEPHARLKDKINVCDSVIGQNNNNSLFRQRLRGGSRLQVGRVSKEKGNYKTPCHCIIKECKL